MKFLRELFSEVEGKASMKRLGMFVMIVVFAITYIKVAIVSAEFVDIPLHWLILLASIMGFGSLVSTFKK